MRPTKEQLDKWREAAQDTAITAKYSSGVIKALYTEIDALIAERDQAWLAVKMWDEDMGVYNVKMDLLRSQLKMANEALVLISTNPSANLKDMVYYVRDYAMEKGKYDGDRWSHPDVLQWNKAVKMIDEALSAIRQMESDLRKSGAE